MSAVAKAPTSVGVAGTTLAHGLLVAAVVLFANRGKGPTTVSYAVTLTAAPAASDVSTRLPEAAPTPKTPEKTVSTKPAPKPKKTEPKPPPKQVKPAETRAATRDAAPKNQEVPLAGEVPSTGHDVLTETFPGLNFPYPEYLSNIINQIYKKFQGDNWPPGLSAIIGFTIHRDGSVTEISVIKQSAGAYGFATAAKGAVEAVAKANLFGRLPDGWPGDELLISFSFSPRKP